MRKKEGESGLARMITDVLVRAKTTLTNPTGTAIALFWYETTS